MGGVLREKTRNAGEQRGTGRQTPLPPFPRGSMDPKQIIRDLLDAWIADYRVVSWEYGADTEGFTDLVEYKNAANFLGSYTPPEKQFP